MGYQAINAGGLTQWDDMIRILHHNWWSLSYYYTDVLLSILAKDGSDSKQSY